MRLPRIKTNDRLTFYHLRARIIGPRHFYPFEKPRIKRMILHYLRKFLKLYFCDLVDFTLMGNHLHLILRFQPYRRLSQRELERRARDYYHRPVDRPQTPRQWRRFNRRLFDVSEFMRNLDGAIARDYNDTNDRRGSLFIDRFGASILTTPADVINCMIYLDLNPVRAGLVDRPEDWEWGATRYRVEGGDPHLVSLRELMPGRSLEERRQEYKWRLYWRGSVGGEEGKRQIPDEVIEAEIRRGAEYGQDLERQRWLTQGVVIGGYDTVAQWLEKLRRRMIYRRQREPVQQRNGACFTLRPQRTRRWDLADTAVPDG